MLISMVGILIGLIVCASVAVIAVDVSCVSQAETWIPRYPNATTVDEVYNFVRPFGMGITLVVLESPDSVQEVRKWYGDHRRNVARTQTQGYATLDWRVTSTVMGGSRIALSSECAWN
jgi:hypothetical protein